MSAVTLAMLEVNQRQPAFPRLYRKCGYKNIDELTFLQNDNWIENFELRGSYSIQTLVPAAVGCLSFYREESSWQGQWQTLMLSQGDGVILSDANKRAVGICSLQEEI